MRAPIGSWLAPVFVGAVVTAGCGTSQPTASGTVWVDNQPLIMGSISFLPLSGTTGGGGGASIIEGKYEVSTGLAEGDYRVEIQGTRRDPGRKVREPFGTGLMAAEVQVVPAEYNEESNLIRTVEPGKNTFDFKLNGLQNR